MLLGKSREILGKLSEDFCLRLVNRPETQAWAKEAITGSGRWNKRDCLLKPLLMVWLTVALTLYRDLSIPNVFRSLVSALRGREPELSPRPITPEAIHHARLSRRDSSGHRVLAGRRTR